MSTQYFDFLVVRDWGAAAHTYRAHGGWDFLDALRVDGEIPEGTLAFHSIDAAWLIATLGHELDANAVYDAARLALPEPSRRQCDEVLGTFFWRGISNEGPTIDELASSALAKGKCCMFSARSGTLREIAESIERLPFADLECALHESPPRYTHGLVPDYESFEGFLRTYAHTFRDVATRGEGLVVLYGG